MTYLLALIPAHNEESCIRDAITGLQNQTRRPNAIVVVLDNCTDDTEKIARNMGVTVFSTQGNTDKKAGALNQALSVYLPHMGNKDRVLVTDADSVLDPDFIQSAMSTLENRSYGGVGGVFRGQEGGGFVGHLQRNEYARYARDVRRLKGKCLVITGTAAVFPVHILRKIVAARLEETLPTGNGRGGVYDTSVLTEDNELSFAIMHLGYKIHSPKGCTLTTEVMPTWRALWQQRRRWKSGAVQNCMQYGLTRITWRYWGRQLLTMAGIVVSFLYLATIAVTPFMGQFDLQLIWVGVMGVFMLERSVTVKDRGWKQMLLSLTMYELVLEFFLQTCHAAAYIRVLSKRTKVW